MEKSSSKKRKKRSKRRSCSSSSDKDDHHKKKRLLEENKQENLTSKSGEHLSSNKTSHREHDRGESFERRTKKSKNSSKKKAKVLKKKYSSSDGSSSSSESETEQERRKRRKHKKKERKKQKKEKWEKELKKTMELDQVRKEDKKESVLKNDIENEDLLSGPMPQPEVPTEDTSRKRPAMVPMTKEEYEKQQSKVRRVFDPDTGRIRLVKGDGEIVEEAVSYQRHKEINKVKQHILYETLPGGAKKVPPL